MPVSPVGANGARPARPDTIVCPSPATVKLQGLVGTRLDACRVNRLHHQEDYHLLWPFQERYPAGLRKQPPPHPEITHGDWQGEFIGTWVLTASLVAENAGDQALQAKIDKLVHDWLATQDEDGYLGTHAEEDRWETWDVWVQAHDLLGLLSYHRHTGNQDALDAAVRVADRVMQDFGPGKRHLHTGPHMGMASSAILEPMVWLYWATGDERYLAFGRWLADEDWEAEGGPAVRSSLLADKGVAGTANAKAAEMLIIFTGLAELYRATGEESYLQPILIAWDDIVQHHLYLTGSASTGEHFMSNYLLRNDGGFFLGETCVTMTWMYLNLSLGRLTGQARYFDMAEQTLYNHLLGAQSPDGRGWTYYMGLRDCKRYRWHTDPDCCPQRGSRALAHMVQYLFGVLQEGDGLFVNFYEAAEATLTLASSLQVEVKQTGAYPFDGQVTIEIRPERTANFALRLRAPGWCQTWQLRLNGDVQNLAPDPEGYLTLERTWSAGDKLELAFEMPPRVVVDKLGNLGRAALIRGPLVYAADTSYLPDGRLLDDITLLLDADEPAGSIEAVENAETGSVHLVVPSLVVEPAMAAGAWKEKERYYELAGGPDGAAANSSGGEAGAAHVETVRLVPFFEAGNRDPNNYRDGVSRNREHVPNLTYQVWLPYILES